MNCEKCGKCCDFIPDVLELKGQDVSEFQHAIDSFPYKAEKGTCEMKVGNLCSVYKDRPMLCDINKLCKYYGLNKAKMLEGRQEQCKQIRKIK